MTANEIEKLRHAAYTACSEMGCFCPDGESGICPICRLEKALHGVTGSARAGRASAEEWNARCKPGQPVVVKRDDGSLWYTKTRSEAWNLGDGRPVVMLEKKSGGYDLLRVTAIEHIETVLA